MHEGRGKEISHSFFFGFFFFFFLVVRMISCDFRQPTSTARRMAKSAVQKLILQVEIWEAQGLLDEG